ncbi:MAG: EscU/YscU/HrcU family type III secretion system export apparatus switch protein [Gemmatimonadaceae bacterium]|nr:EscU/YscU/HrcU family type III secretion system export apparatus switch protein [Gemmatimonadaceae bacterium]
MALSDQEKTEAPTQRRRDEAKKEGRIPRSPELTTSFVLLGSALLLNLAAPMGHAMVGIFGDGLRAMAALPNGTDSAINLLRATGVRTLLVVGGWGAALMAMGLAIAAPQARGVFSLKPLTPDFARLDPSKNVSRVVGTQSLANLVTSLAKLGLVSLVVYKALGASWHDMMALSQQSSFGFVMVTKTYVVKLLMTAGLAYLVLAAADYAWQLWRHEQQLKMSRDEIREEMKQSEGDPLVKQRMRSFARAIARRQMMRNVPKADVVVTNPTHIAVALQYDPDKAPAPIVLAMGQRKVAEKIKKIARESGVPCIENKPIARALLAGARVGQLIPADLYIAVAEILAFVIRRRLVRGKALGELVA